MKRLKSLLRCNYLYYGLVLIVLLMALFSDSNKHICSYGDLFEDEFVIEKIAVKDKGVRLYLKGEEKVIASYYLGDAFVKDFLNDYKLGYRVVIKGEEVKLKNNTVRNTFNYKEYLHYQGIYHSVVISDIKLVKKNNNLFYKFKNYLIDRQNLIDKSYEYTSSLLFGDNSLIDEDVMESYRSNGVSHLFAISGLHVSLFLLLFSKFLERLGLRKNKKYVFFILFLLFYMFLTNFSMSVMRASIFTILMIVNKVFRLEIKAINLLLLTLVTILFINPFNLFNIGLQYSFLISCFLIKYSDVINSLSGFKKLFFVSLVAFLVSYPITVNNFYEVNFLSILYNLVFVPFVSYLLLPFALIVYFLPAFDEVLYIFISLIELASQFIQRIDIFKVIMCKLNVTMVLLYYVILCLVLSNYKNGKKKYLFLLFLFYFIHFLMPFWQEDYVEFLDVNQGDAFVINVNGNATLIDTGGVVMYSDSKYTYQLAKNRILPYLKSQGIRKIDNLVLTHGDFDHMGEAKYLVENFKVEKLTFNCGAYNNLEKDLIKVLDRNDIKYQSCINKLDIDNVNFKFLKTREYDNENDNSNVIYAEINNKKFLFMGDASITTEEEILNKYNFSSIDVLKVGHHGSNTSSSEEFINEINPKYSIISVGKNNRYGHPNKEVLDNLKNTKIYRTDEDGSIMFKIKNNKLKIETCSP